MTRTWRENRGAVASTTSRMNEAAGNYNHQTQRQETIPTTFSEECPPPPSISTAVLFCSDDPEEPDIEIPVTTSTTSTTSSSLPMLSEPASPADEPPATDEQAATEAITTTFTPALRLPPPFYCPVTHELFLDPVVAPNGLSYEQNIVLILPNPELFNHENNGHIMLSNPQFYPNRALQQIMKEYQDLNGENTDRNGEDADFSGDTWKAGIRRSHTTIENGIQQIWDQSYFRNRGSSSGDGGGGGDDGAGDDGDDGAGTAGTAGAGPDRPLPDAYYCPITFDLLHVPVIDPEGNTYEKAAIVSWIQANGNSPLSRSPLTVYELYPNHAIRQLLKFHANDLDVDVDGRTRTPIQSALLQWKTELPPVLPEANEDGQQQEQQRQQQFNIPYFIRTLEELEDNRLRVMRLRQNVFVCTIWVIVCFVLAFALVAVFQHILGIFFIVFFGCSVGLTLHKALEYLADQQSRIQNALQRLLQLQQEQQQNPNNNITINNDDSSSTTNNNSLNEEDIAELGGNDAPGSIPLSGEER